MHVAEILARKGPGVSTIEPTNSIKAAIEAMAELRVGALVVSADGSSIDGIFSERDVVRALADQGGELLEAPVSSIMTSLVWTCAPSDTVEQLMSRMTEQRIRHIPVEQDGQLTGIVSIGDVVKWRLTELEDEARHVQDYIQNTGYS